MHKIIKQCLLAISLIITILGISWLNLGQSTAQAAESNDPVTCRIEIYFQSDTDSQNRVDIGSLVQTLDASDLRDATYDDLLKALGTSDFQDGTTIYDFINAFFDWSNQIISNDDALAKFNQMIKPPFITTLAALNQAKAQYISGFPNSSVYMERTQAEAQQLVTPKLQDTHTYQVPDFTIYITPNNYQMTIKYVLPNGAPAHADRVVTGYAGKTPATITSPVAPNGDVPNQTAVTVNFAKAGNYETVVHYRKPGTTITPAQPTTTDQASLTAMHQATITLGDSVTAATFNARATDAAGQAIPVTVDLSQVKQNRPGNYTVTLKAANGKSLTATLTINPAKAAVSATRFQPFKVYALKTLYLYQHPTFNRHQRLVKYPKAKRTQRPLFVVTGEAHSKAGRLRYRVKDVNAKRKTAGKTGYVTAKKAFIAPAYYQQAAKQIKVINQSGINVYTDLGLTKKVKHVGTGHILKVTGIRHHHLTTRFVLANGRYISANKRLAMTIK